MPIEPISILIVEDNPADLLLVQELLADVPTAPFHLETAERLADGLACLAHGGAEVILLDLMLPDSEGLSTLARTRECAPDVPIVVLTGLNADELATGALNAGAQDYLVKGRLDSETLARAIRYALERHRLLMALKNLALTDELTGLYNRRGFMALAEHQVKVARRTGRGLMLLYLDVDDFKAINDTYGHHEGDRALQQVAQLLRHCFRDSDILARLGGDEFAALALDVNEGAGIDLPARLIQALQTTNATAYRPYDLSVSGGTAVLDHDLPDSLEDLLVRADAAMYFHKQRHVRRDHIVE